jgi:hypothetical protein
VAAENGGFTFQRNTEVEAQIQIQQMPLDPQVLKDLKATQVLRAIKVFRG